jgi:hypothetical protein
VSREAFLRHLELIRDKVGEPLLVACRFADGWPRDLLAENDIGADLTAARVAPLAPAMRLAPPAGAPERARLRRPRKTAPAPWLRRRKRFSDGKSRAMSNLLDDLQR